jgi:hypothetical protein
MALASVVATTFVCVACAVEPVGQEPRQDTPDDESTRGKGDAPATPTGRNADAPARAEAEDPATGYSGCSIVQYCNAPGLNGTVCLQQGCSVAAARSECRSESKYVCGSPVCPWEFIASDGQHFLDPSCCSSGIACGNECCGAGTAYCGVAFACCDGIHCSAHCPC